MVKLINRLFPMRGYMFRCYSILLISFLSVSYSPRVNAEYYDLTLWQSIKMGVYGLISGAYLEQERPGIKSSFKRGSQQSIIEFDIKAAQKFSGTLYLPMLSATFKITSPDGTVVFDSKNTAVKHNRGAKDDAAYPWVLYFLPELFSEHHSGKWQVEVNYPNAASSGEIYLALGSSLIFNSEIKTDPYYRVLSDRLDISVDLHSSGQAPDKVEARFNITFPDKSSEQYIALDGGVGADATNRYTINQTLNYQQTGLHVIESEMDVSYLDEVYTLKSLKNIWVTEDLASVEKVKIITESIAGSCIKEVKLIADIHLKKSGNYKLLGIIEGSENSYYGPSFELFYGEVGLHQVEISYPKKALLSSFSKKELITFAPLRVLKTDYENQHKSGYNAYLNRFTTINNSFQLADLNFCREDIEVDKSFFIEEQKQLGSDKISALQLRFNVAVNDVALYGYYVNFRDSSSDDYGSSFGGRYHESLLEEGDNQLLINIDASRLKEFKGGKVKADFYIWKKGQGARLDKRLSTTIRTYQPSDFSN